MNTNNFFSLKRKTNIIIAVLLISIFFLVWLLSVIRYKKECRIKAEEEMCTAIKETADHISLENTANQEQIASSLRLFSYFLKQAGHIIQEKDSIERQVIDYETGETTYRKIPVWTIKGKDFSTLQTVIDNIYRLTGVEAAIFQKMPEGYIIVASGFDRKYKNKMSDFYVPNSSSVIPIVENGEIHIGTFDILNRKFEAAFFPLFINSKINGMIACMKEFELSKESTERIANTRFGQTGRMFAISPANDIFVHADLESGQVVRKEIILEHIISAKDVEGIHNLEYQQKGRTYCQKTLYLSEIDTYVGVSCPIEELHGDISSYSKFMAWVCILGVIGSLIILLFFSHYSFETIKRIKNALTGVSKGGDVARNFQDQKRSYLREIAKIEQIVFKIYADKKERMNCLKNLVDKNYEKHTSLSQGEDKEADLLLELKNNLSKNYQEDKLKSIEVKNTEWINTGLTKFIDILRFHGKDRAILAYNIISNIVNYIGANQGAIYFTDDETGDKYFDMAACYAYEKQKIINKRIPTDEGLLGRSFHEKRIINISDIPNNYIHIVSGLGMANPSHLIIVPLVFNNVISGMLEIASFHTFEEHHVKFLERIAESIASAISGLKITEKTESLLQQSKETSKLMKIQEVELLRNLKEMKRLREESTAKETEMKGLFKAMDATSLVFEYDKDGLITHVNTKASDLFQMQEEEFIGKSHSDFSSFSPDNKQYIKFWDDIRSGRTRSLSESITTKQKVVWLSETFTPILNEKGEVTKIINIGMDISETKVLERQLRSQEKEINRQMDRMNEKEKELKERQNDYETREREIKFFNQAINQAVCTIVFNRRGIIMEVNSKFLELTKYKEEEVISRDLNDFIMANNVSKFEKCLHLVSQNKVVHETLGFETKEKKNLVMGVTLSPFINEKNDLESVLMVASLISR